MNSLASLLIKFIPWLWSTLKSSSSNESSVLPSNIIEPTSSSSSSSQVKMLFILSKVNVILMWLSTSQCCRSPCSLPLFMSEALICGYKITLLVTNFNVCYYVLPFHLQAALQWWTLVGCTTLEQLSNMGHHCSLWTWISLSRIHVNVFYERFYVDNAVLKPASQGGCIKIVTDQDSYNHVIYAR